MILRGELPEYQCSQCFAEYTFADMFESGPTVRLYCAKCSKPFHRNKWQVLSRVKSATAEPGQYYIVSTVHLEMQHGYTSPMWYETTIYKEEAEDGGGFLKYQQRYPSMQEALLGHRRTITRLDEIIEEEQNEK